VTGSCCIAFAHHVSAMPMYPSCASDYPTVLSLFSHHIWVGGILTLGAGAHASIFFVSSFYPSHSLSTYLFHILKHRDILLGHLLWVSIGLGFHSFGLYIHNDSLQGLGRPEDTFSDNSIQLKPIFALAVVKYILHFDMQVMLGEKSFCFISQELGTADLMVHHIHAFTIHVTLLILAKGVLYARSSRLVSDKLEKGFRYPCDGPGRGGTCQISAWDHVFLGVFWMYNSLSEVLFHFFWKMQSDVWGTYVESKASLVHISSSDYSLHSTSINGWLRNFLWSSSAQAIQSYATSISLWAHFSSWPFCLGI